MPIVTERQEVGSSSPVSAVQNIFTAIALVHFSRNELPSATEELARLDTCPNGDARHVHRGCVLTVLDASNIGGPSLPP